MKLMFTACTACGARSTSPLGLCPECEDRRMHARVARARAVRQQVRRGRRAA